MVNIFFLICKNQTKIFSYADTEIDMTYEGDNHVLLQQISKAVMADYFSGRLKDFPPVVGVQ
jgi:hypothetical protein